MPESDRFGRDLGYLDRFLEKLESHAGTLPAASGQRLRALIEEERRRWSEIRQLLDEATPVGQSGDPSPDGPPEAEPSGTEAAEPVSAATAAPLPAFDHPYRRAFDRGMAALRNLPPRPDAEASPDTAPTAAPTPPASPGAAAPQGGWPSGFTVGSLKRTR